MDTATVTLTDEQVARLIEMYQAENPDGSPQFTTADITRELHIPRGTQYWTLRAFGITPKRMRRTPSGKPTIEELLHEIADLRAHLAVCEAELEREKRVNTRLMRLMKAVQDTEAKTSKRSTKSAK
jgi:hypothetical protein